MYFNETLYKSFRCKTEKIHRNIFFSKIPIRSRLITASEAYNNAQCFDYTPHMCDHKNSCLQFCLSFSAPACSSITLLMVKYFHFPVNPDAHCMHNRLCVHQRERAVANHRQVHFLMPHNVALLNKIPFNLIVIMQKQDRERNFFTCLMNVWQFFFSVSSLILCVGFCLQCSTL